MTYFRSSWRHVLCFSCPHNTNARTCSPCLVGCCTSPSSFFHPCLTSTQVFYGRYLKRLSNQTQEALGEMNKVRITAESILNTLVTRIQVAQESLAALRTVQAFNALPQERDKFHTKMKTVLELARREANASGIFFGSTAWSGNITLLALLGYGQNLPSHADVMFICWVS